MSRLRPHIRATLALALPLVGSHLAQITIGATDTIMVGWYGAPELAAVSMGAAYFHVVLILGQGFGLAVMPLAAAAAAARAARRVRRVTRMGLWIAAIFGVLSLPLFLFSERILLAAGQTAELSVMAADYLRIAGAGIVFAALTVTLRSHLAALGRTRIVLWSTLAGFVLNVALNWVLIFGNAGAPEMGLAGAALASVATHGVICVILAVYAARARGLKRFRLFARFWRPDGEVLSEVFRLGWPISLTLLAESGLFMASLVMMGWIGTRELAAHGIAIQIASITFMVHIGLSSAATVRAGRAWGAGDAEALRLGAVAAIVLSGAMVLATVAAFLGVPGALIGLFLDPADPARAEIVALGTAFLAVAALFQLADAAQVMALGLLRGVQDTRVPMVLAVMAYWVVGVPAGYLLGFPLGFGGPGIWMGLVIGLALAGGTMMARFWMRAGGPPRAPLPGNPRRPALPRTGGG
ncbi:MATE family efflux transporter [Rhodobacterales bacterium HKCCE2091]|nr:MATE family efflux transporter [Rhodobacterales bacterium HKCCE2091]